MNGSESNWKKRCNTWGSSIAFLACGLLCSQVAAADLHDAVRSGKLDRVQEEVSRGGNVNERDNLGATPLLDAVWSGNLEIAAYLIAQGARVNVSHAEGGSTPMAYAVIKNDLKMAELLLSKGADVKAADHSGATPLHLAVDRGYQKIAELMLEHGADVNARDKSGAAPLDEAAVRGYAALAGVLIARSARIDEENPERGATPLNEAAAKGNRPIVELLLSRGADRNRRDRNGLIPLENAVRGRHLAVAELLLEGVKPAALDGLILEAALKGQTEIADLLIAKGANVNCRDKAGATPLHQAALKGNTDIANVLLQHGADPNAADGDGLTPLHDAALSGRAPMIALLLDKGANREARDRRIGSHSALPGGVLGAQGSGRTVDRARRGCQRQKQHRRLTRPGGGQERFCRNRPPVARARQQIGSSCPHDFDPRRAAPYRSDEACHCSFRTRTAAVSSMR